MAKTKPIGVRFDEDLLVTLKDDGIADSPQKALNYLTEFYRENKDKKFDFKKMMEESKLFKIAENATKNTNQESKKKFDETTIKVKNVTYLTPNSTITDFKTGEVVKNNSNIIQKVLEKKTPDGYPERKAGESSLDYKVRCIEWNEQQKK